MIDRDKRCRRVVDSARTHLPDMSLSLLVEDEYKCKYSKHMTWLQMMGMIETVYLYMAESMNNG